MKIYIGWSGKRGKQLGAIFNKWLPYFLHSCEPFYSEDIGKGRQWLMEITDELRDSSFGIICLTKDSLNAPWILYEAGALSKGLQENHVCPFLLDLKSSEVEQPLSQFQTTQNTKEELLKLLKTINSNAERKIGEQLLLDNYENWYPKFEQEIQSIPSYDEVMGESVPPPREQEEILEEMLEILRDSKRKRTEIPVQFIESKRQAIGIPDQSSWSGRDSNIDNVKLKINPKKIVEINESIKKLFGHYITKIHAEKELDKEGYSIIHIRTKPFPKYLIEVIGMIDGVIQVKYDMF